MWERGAYDTANSSPERDYFRGRSMPVFQVERPSARTSRLRLPPNENSLDERVVEPVCSNGTLPHEKPMRSIDLFGTQVAPRVREAIREADS